MTDGVWHLMQVFMDVVADFFCIIRTASVNLISDDNHCMFCEQCISTHDYNDNCGNHPFDGFTDFTQKYLQQRLNTEHDNN